MDDHNHDLDGAFHKTAVEEIGRAIAPLQELSNDHALFRSFFTFDDGPPTTGHELNGWGDNIVHRHLLAVQRDDRLSVLYSNKDYSSEWNYHPENKRFLSVDNTKFAVNVSGLCPHALNRCASASSGRRARWRLRCWRGPSGAPSCPWHRWSA